MADPSNQNLTCSSENSRQPATASTSYASLDAHQNTVQIPGTSSSGTIAAPGSQIADDLVNAEGSAGQLSKEEADRLYEENIEEEYAKREGGA